MHKCKFVHWSLRRKNLIMHSKFDDEEEDGYGFKEKHELPYMKKIHKWW